MDIWRLPRKSDAPLFAAGYLIVFHIYHQTSKKKKVGESNAGKSVLTGHLSELKQKIENGLEELKSSKELYEFKSEYLEGKKSKISGLMKEMKTLPRKSAQTTVNPSMS